MNPYEAPQTESAKKASPRRPGGTVVLLSVLVLLGLLLVVFGFLGMKKVHPPRTIAPPPIVSPASEQ